MREKEEVQYIQAIFKMNTCELLTEILHNPEYLVYSEHSNFKDAIKKRAEQLGIPV